MRAIAVTGGFPKRKISLGISDSEADRSAIRTPGKIHGSAVHREPMTPVSAVQLNRKQFSVARGQDSLAVGKPDCVIDCNVPHAAWRASLCGHGPQGHVAGQVHEAANQEFSAVWRQAKDFRVGEWHSHRSWLAPGHGGLHKRPSGTLSLEKINTGTVRLDATPRLGSSGTCDGGCTEQPGLRRCRDPLKRERGRQKNAQAGYDEGHPLQRTGGTAVRRLCRRLLRRRFLPCRRSVQHAHGQSKPVTAFRHGLDDLYVVCIPAEGFAELGNVLGQGHFLHENPRPELLDEVIFSNQLPGILDQDDEGIKDLGRKGYGLSLTCQQVLRRMQAEVAEDVYLLARAGHRFTALKKCSEFYQEISKVSSRLCLANRS